MTGIYFSGTGNTKYCVETFVRYVNGGASVSIESPDAIEATTKAQEIVLGYPVYFSNIPKIVYDFIQQNGAIFKGKRVYIIATMSLFSGDGAGCAARLLKKQGAAIVGGLHLQMPDCVGDVRLLKKPLATNRKIVKNATVKMKRAADRLKRGTPTQDGLNVVCRIAGLFGQRLWFYGKPKSYSSDLKIRGKRCNGCGRCVSLCPMGNLSISNQKAAAGSRCTMCYRCISNCPQKAIMLLGKEVVEQCLLEKYI